MAQIDKTYHKLLSTIIHEGYNYEDPNRKGVFRRQISNYTIKHDFKDGFPAITTKRLAWKSIVGELLWILRGDTNIKFLVDNGIPIWNKDAYNYYLSTSDNPVYDIDEFVEYIKNNDEDHLKRIRFGEVGLNYGAQLRNWDNGSTDQLYGLINTLKSNPMATKKTVTFWNPAEAEKTALTPCHWSFEALVEPISVADRTLFKRDNSPKGWTVNNSSPTYALTIKWHQHSVDTFLGLPFNIAFYSLLCQVLAKLTGMQPKGVVGDLSNVHIYHPHLKPTVEQLGNFVGTHPECELKSFDGFKIGMHGNIDQWLNHKEISDFKLKDYSSFPRIVAEMLPYSI